MASIFNALNIGYTGLSAAQVGINTTGQNIANAEVDGYTRQRVIATAATPITTGSGIIGNGVEIQTIKRVFDNYLFDRYTNTYVEKEYTDFEQSSLQQLSTYFPEIDNVGIKSDLQEYYNMWQTFADNSDNDSIKIALAKQTEELSAHISYTQNQVKGLQSQLNDQLYTNLNQVNTLAKELAGINLSIDTAESGTLYDANDLRDKRNVLERDLARLIGAQPSSGQLEANIQVGSNSNTKTGSYTVNINGFNIVDGTRFHPIHVDNKKNSNGFYDISFEREDGVLVPMEENINGGKVGAILNLRGGRIDTTSGVPKDGIIQNTIAELDAFAQGLIESTNNLYAQNLTTRMDSKALNIDPRNAILSSDLNINAGSFNLVVYDIDGNVTASREMTIDVATTMQGLAGGNSIEAKLNANVDDNGDGSAGNDIDDFLNFNWATFADGTSKLEFTLDPLSESNGYRFAIEDKLTTTAYASGSNFAGALGLNQFFEGDSASNIDLAFKYKENETLISAGYTDVAGDNRMALNMVQHQFEKYDYEVGNLNLNTTSYGMFDIIATEVGTHTNAAIIRSETVTTQFNAVQLEYFSTSKVGIDEELTNLIKYQTSYGAAAKIITTIDQMMKTLLGIK